ncbi:alanine--tRNA ligase [Borrelia miyamotoi]|uniref:Alanine--tRNA ligase n=1 Tax=Borrelia miyamotoi TaxID=47466 RepID=A0AAP8YRZ6_9SPIR|nr:alanine--tRNA ligase [Borrelia miyamotoi]AHH05197.1 Alanyl-tRNA synthetase [Borrelia miyamotoi FR64b]ATQ14978.1 alanine--tRNA ligase [Borrelia miyamotoi]ATQ16161.1 alanine--tRNA ligase [Borrelia miyamotoi]ATQ17306.1 alanine--tRNA ligase [Borrelia miyamotoi]ATQ18188.1 alanine--tRNA ligase [Borrelia miyamotoi]
MKLNELRKKYIEFFKSKGHYEIAGKSLIPDNDSTVLFNTAGMQPLVPYLLGEMHPSGDMLVNVQKCLRTGDIDEVGDFIHLTFFEMLGNWSFGAYFKELSVKYSFEFLTSPNYLNISKNKLYVSVFEGDESIPRDIETANVWESLGISRDRIFYLSRESNFWGPVGNVGPCGPDTEIFVDTGKEKCSTKCDITCSCGKYFEIWNNVFMQYKRDENGNYEELNRKCVDTGMGLERTITFLQGKSSVYDTDAFKPIIDKIEKISGKIYGQNLENDRAMRIIADHIKASCFILADHFSVSPSNMGQGYVLRRIIRRAIRYAKKLGMEAHFLADLVDSVLEIYESFYEELTEKKEFIKAELNLEEEKFFKTLRYGEQEFVKLIKRLSSKSIPGNISFKLYDTYGFPYEITEELAAEHGFSVDKVSFEEHFRKHQEVSKKGGNKVFKGGLADCRYETTKLHTATHLLHRALQLVLGDHVRQKGSNITGERLRFDFSHPYKMTDDEIKKVEDMVNLQIKSKLSVRRSVMSLDDALAKGAMALFGEKYEDVVSVYEIDGFSIEVCGGPHVNNTGELGIFKIQKEQASSSGIRRIRAILIN